MKKKVLLVVVMLLSIISSYAVDLGGVVSMNARYRFGQNASASKTGDFVFDVVRLNFSHETDRFKVYASVRNYAESFGGLTVPEAYFMYKATSGNWSIGSMRLPIYQDVWFSNAYYSDMNYYMGFGDKFMMGIAWDKQFGDKWYVSAGFYKNPMTSISWSGDEIEKSRYSNDINKVKTIDGEFTAREENQLAVGFTYKPSENFHIRWFNKIGNLSVCDIDKNPDYLTIDFTSILSLTWNINKLQVGYAAAYFNNDLTDKGLTSITTTAFGFDAFGLSHRPEGHTQAIKAQYILPKGFRSYAEASGLFDQSDVFDISRSMILVGLNYTHKCGLSASLEYIHGKDHPWVQSRKNGNLVNLNLSYYF